MGCCQAKPEPMNNTVKTNFVSAGGSAAGAPAADQIQAQAPPLPPHIVGTFSNHGIEHDYENQAVVKINQDRGSVDYPFVGGDSSALFCVMDGHGKQGDKVSEYCILNLHQHLYENEDKFIANPGATMTRAYVEVDQALEADSSIESFLSGTSAVTVYMSDRKLCIANAGDSRAVIGSNLGHTKDLSVDQNPNSPGEQERLEANGGYVAPPEDVGLSARVWSPDLLIGLSMARSLGDHKLAQFGVIAEPEITEHDICEEDTVMILASDGIWEFISSQEAVDIVTKCPDDATEACRRLILLATKKWRDEEGPYRDDITAIVVFIQPLFAHFAASAGARTIGLRRNSDCNELPMIQDGDDVQPDHPVVSVIGPEDDSLAPRKPGKASTFRKRRLSTMGGDSTAAAEAVAHAAELAKTVAPAEPKGKGARLGRRPSISMDMDPSGKKIQPN